MKNIINALRNYISETLGFDITVAAWDGNKYLPFFLREHYDYFQATLAEVPCLFMIDKSTNEQTPGTIQKHISLLRPKAGDCEILYVRHQITAHNRKRLVEHKVPFIVPGNQMYLPMLAIDFREYFRKNGMTVEKFSPSTQVVILHVLLKFTGNSLRLRDPAQRYAYSLMTMSRAFDEIEQAGIGAIVEVGRERQLSCADNRRDLWKNAVSLLCNPVKRKVYTRQSDATQTMPLAGLSALAAYSLLAEPEIPVYAMSSSNWNSFRAINGAEIVSSDESDACEIEIWSYDPGFFSNNNIVDRLSLFLSLRDNKDERIESALEQMMKDLPW